MSRLGSSGHPWWRRHETLPFVAQMEFAECGAACLCAVLRRYGHHASLLDVRLACDVSRDGTSAWDLAQAARGYGLKVDALRATYAGIRKRAAGPLILHWQGNHFVAVERFTRRGAILMDPASGRRAAGHAELARSFTGIALMLRPEPAFVRKKRASTLARPIALMRQAGGDMAFIALTLFFLEVIGLLFPALTQVLIDGIVLPRQEDWLWILGAVGASAALLELGLRVLRDDASRRLGATLDVELKHRFVQRLMALPVLFFRQRAPGDLLQRAAGTAALRSLTTSLVQVSLDACLVLGYAALMLAYHPGLAALTIALNVLQVALMVLITLPTGRLIATELVHSGKESATLMEALHSPEAVHAFGAQSFFRERYHDRLVARLSSGVAWRRYTHGSGALNVLLDAVTLVLVLWVGGNHVIAGEMTPGALAAFLALQAMLVQPMGALVAFLYELRGVRGVLERIEDIEDAPPEASGSEAPLALRGELKFRGVAFGYRRNTDPLFQNVDFEVRPGEHIAIVGASGAGKSTLLSLLLGLSTPSEGSIEIDGRDLRTIALAPFRRAVGVVLQDPFFIDDTVRANLCLSDPELPLERVVAAARLACIDSVIEALPRGYDTPIGEAGQRLSGGERQRLALARALVSHPRILIMDEATSAMDAETERRVQANLGQLEITRLTIAHRLGTVRNAHRIVVLANGGVAQEGRYEQLAQVPGLFRDMLEAGS